MLSLHAILFTNSKNAWTPVLIFYMNTAQGSIAISNLVIIIQCIQCKADVQVIPVLWFFPLRNFCSTIVVVAFASRTNVLWPVTTDIFCKTMNLNNQCTNTILRHHFNSHGLWTDTDTTCFATNIYYGYVFVDAKLPQQIFCVLNTAKYQTSQMTESPVLIDFVLVVTISTVTTSWSQIDSNDLANLQQTWLTSVNFGMSV